MDVIVCQCIVKHVLSVEVRPTDAFTVKLQRGLSNSSQIQVGVFFSPIISEEI